VPGALVRDIGLPAFTHAPHHSQTGPVRVRPPPVGEG
jgi:hypothetical protein